MVRFPYLQHIRSLALDSVALGVVVVLAGCGDDNANASDSTSGSSGSLTTSTTDGSGTSTSAADDLPGPSDSSTTDNGSSGDSTGDGPSMKDAETFVEVVVYEAGQCNDACPPADENRWSASAMISNEAPDVMARVACATGSVSFGGRLCLPSELPEDGTSVPVATSATLDDTVSGLRPGALRVPPITLSPINGEVEWWFSSGSQMSPVPAGTTVEGNILGDELQSDVVMPGPIAIVGENLEWDAGTTNAYALIGDQIQNLDDSGSAPIPAGANRAFTLAMHEDLFGTVWLRVVQIHIIPIAR